MGSWNGHGAMYIDRDIDEVYAECDGGCVGQAIG